MAKVFDDILRSIEQPSFFQKAEFTPAMERAMQVSNHRAYQGTPHDFKTAQTSKIGTGEGQQAYGWGLYYAKQRDVSRGYRDMLTRAFNPKTGKKDLPITYRNEKGEFAYLQSDQYHDTGYADAVDALMNTKQQEHLQAMGPADLIQHSVARARMSGGKPEDVIKDLQGGVDHFQKRMEGKEGSLAKQDLEENFQTSLLALSSAKRQLAEGKLKKSFDGIVPGKPVGYIHDVNIPDPVRMMDQRSPIVGQAWYRDLPVSSKKELRGVYDETGLQSVYGGDSFHELDGAQVYHVLKTAMEGGLLPMGDPKNVSKSASLFLKEKLGVPGMVYEGRASGETNYIVFDDKAIKNISREKGFIDQGALAATGLLGISTGGGIIAFNEEGAQTALDNGYTNENIALYDNERQASPEYTVAGAWDALKTVGSGVIGGLAGSASKVGGIFNPTQTPEESVQGAEALQQKLLIPPTEESMPYLEPLQKLLKPLGSAGEQVDERLPDPKKSRAGLAIGALRDWYSPI